MSARAAGAGRWWDTAGASPTERILAASARLRGFDARHPWAYDLALTALVALLGVAGLVGGTHGRAAEARDVPSALPWLLHAGLTLPLLLRRRRPLAVMSALFAVAVVDGLTGVQLASEVSLVIALYGVALRLPLSRLGWVGGMLVAATVITTVARWTGADIPQDNGAVYTLATATAVAGVAVRVRREHLASLLDRARRLEIERDQQARLAAAAERARMSREMHDILAHNLAVIVGLADGGSRASRTSPERGTQALDAIATTGRHALGELRRLLGVLRNAPDEAELSPQPGLTDLPRLLDQVRAAGLPVTSHVRGAVGDLSEGRQLSAYRIVQESLTNTLKHGGPGAVATVTVAYGPEGIDVEVLDTGRGDTGRGDTGGPAGVGIVGQGIVGMRDRATLYDGTLDAGPLPARGWRVRAHLRGDPARGRPALPSRQSDTDA
jgi:signal transduction histidine kinase